MAKALWRARHKFAALVVGLDFHQTDPAFLRRFRSYARIQESADGTFHPKLYVFRRRDQFDAVVGSSNLTHGGFGRNVEANVHLAGSTSDPRFAQLTKFIEQLADAGRLMLERDLDNYEDQWKKRGRDVERAKKFRPLSQKPRRGGPMSLHIDWPSFVQGMLNVAASKGLSVYPNRGDADDIGYLGVIKNVQALFRRRQRLSSMSDEERQKVAGLIDPYGHFGRMIGAGLFMHYVLKQPGRLDKALDHIPARPAPVSRRQFDAFKNSITQTKGLGRPAVGSRLLAMKRPDVFLCLDSANRLGLSESFGLTPGRLNSYDGYWELMELLWKCPWYKARGPKGRREPIWDARVALVDAFFYEV